MHRRSSTWFSVGISLALMALGLWFIYDHHVGLMLNGGGWPQGHGSFEDMGMGVVKIIFWVIVLIAVMALVAGVLSEFQARRSRAHSSEAVKILKRR